MSQLKWKRERDGIYSSDAGMIVKRGIWWYCYPNGDIRTEQRPYWGNLKECKDYMQEVWDKREPK